MSYIRPPSTNIPIPMESPDEIFGGEAIGSLYDPTSIFDGGSYVDSGGFGTPVFNPNYSGGGSGGVSSGVSNIFNDIQDFANSDLGKVLLGVGGSIIQNNAVNDALTQQGNYTRAGIDLRNDWLNRYIDAAMPFRDAGVAAIPGVTDRALNPYEFQMPDFSREINARNRGYDFINDLMNGGGNQLYDVMSNDWIMNSPFFPINNQTLDANYSFGSDINPLSAYKTDSLINPLNYDSGPYQVMFNEGMRAVTNFQNARGKTNSGETLERLQQLGTGLKQNQINTAMALRGQQFGEMDRMYQAMFGQRGQDFGFDITGRQQNQSEIGQNFNQSLAQRGFESDERLRAFDTLARYRNQMFGENLGMFNSALNLTNAATNQPVDIYRTLFNAGLAQDNQNFSQLFNLATLGANTTARVGTDALSAAGANARALDELGNATGAADIAKSNVQTNLLGDILGQLGFTFGGGVTIDNSTGAVTDNATGQAVNNTGTNQPAPITESQPSYIPPPAPPQVTQGSSGTVGQQIVPNTVTGGTINVRGTTPQPYSQYAYQPEAVTETVDAALSRVQAQREGILGDEYDQEAGEITTAEAGQVIEAAINEGSSIEDLAAKVGVSVDEAKGFVKKYYPTKFGAWANA